VRITIAVVAGVCAAVCFALGTLVQPGAARQTHARALRFGLLVALAHQRRWLGGIAVTVLAFGIQAAALAFGPLTLVQTRVATEVLFALPMIAHRNRLPLQPGLRAELGRLQVVRARLLPDEVAGWPGAGRRERAVFLAGREDVT
jgi:hypothetical protein